jgi:hypothetical protein
MLGTPNMVPYSATKFALTGFMEGLHYELKNDKVSQYFRTLLDQNDKVSQYFRTLLDQNDRFSKYFRTLLDQCFKALRVCKE